MKLRLFFAGFLLPFALLAETNLFDKVENIDVGINGYTLGKTLTLRQKTIAEKNPEKANVEGTYKFYDEKLHVVADKKSDRVVLIYQAYDRVDYNTLKQLVSKYIGDFEEPTTISHNNIIYWFYHENGYKITFDEFEAWRNKMNENESGKSAKKSLSEVLKEDAANSDEKKLHQLVTVKLQSTKPIIANEPFLDATVYLMISSEQLIRENYSLRN